MCTSFFAGNVVGIVTVDDIELILYLEVLGYGRCVMERSWGRFPKADFHEPS